jgi:hypothetical protein
LGLSIGNPQGRGVGPIDTDKIFENLARSRAIKSGFVTDIEDFRIFVPGIDKDKMSDLTTNIYCCPGKKVRWFENHPT